MAVTRYGFLDLLRQRADQPGFHIASEDGVRIELMRFQKGQTLGPLSCDGELVLTCLDGTFDIGDGTPVPPMTQVVVPRGESLFEPGDEVLALVTPDSEDEMRELLTGSAD